MKRVILCVKDSATELFGQPFFVPAVGAGLRDFIDQVNRRAEDNPLFQHPEDFYLYHLGEYDDETGTFHAHELGCPAMLMRGKDAVRQVPSVDQSNFKS